MLATIRSRLALWAWAACLLLLVADNAAAQEPLVIPFDGTQVFGHFLVRELQPLADRDELFKVDAATAVLVCFGDLSPLKDWPAGALEKFRDDGGAVLIASDRAAELAWGVTIEPGNVYQDRRTAFRRQEACPRLVFGADQRHPLLKGIASLATNGPTTLRLRRESLDVVATFPADCDRVVGRFSFPADKAILMAAGGEPNAGRALIVSGPGIYFNGMLLQKDIDNLRFALNSIDWLREADSDKPRTSVLFMVNGEVIARPGLPLPPLKFNMPPIPPTEVLNEILRGLERDNTMNRLVEQAFGDRLNLLRACLLLLSLLLLLHGGWRLVRSRYWFEKKVPLIIDPGEPAKPGPAPLQGRFEELSRSGNYWELAQVLARQWYWRHADIEPWQWDRNDFEMTPAIVTGPWWRRFRMKAQLARVADLARHAPTWSFGARRVRRLRRLLDELTNAVDQGTIMPRGESRSPAGIGRSSGSVAAGGL